MHREKLRLVDPNACWDEIAPRPRRQQRRAPNAPLPQVAHQLPQQNLNINMPLLPVIGPAQRPPAGPNIEPLVNPPDAPIPVVHPPDVIARPPTPPLGDAPERARTPEPMEYTEPARAQEPMETAPTAHKYPLRKRSATITAPELELAK